MDNLSKDTKLVVGCFVQGSHPFPQSYGFVITLRNQIILSLLLLFNVAGCCGTSSKCLGLCEVPSICLDLLKYTQRLLVGKIWGAGIIGSGATEVICGAGKLGEGKEIQLCKS